MSDLKLDEFLEGISVLKRNCWLYYENPPMEVYIRKSNRLLAKGSKLITCLDVANVTVLNQGEGTFSHWLDIAIDSAKRHNLDAIYIENVLTKRFAEYFRRLGWIEIWDGIAPSFYLLLKD